MNFLVLGEAERRQSEHGQSGDRPKCSLSCAEKQPRAGSIQDQSVPGWQSLESEGITPSTPCSWKNAHQYSETSSNMTAEGEGHLGKCSARVFFKNQKPRPAVNVTCTRFIEKKKRQQEDYLLYKQMKQLQNPLEIVSIPAKVKLSSFVLGTHQNVWAAVETQHIYWQTQFSKPRKSYLDLLLGIKLYRPPRSSRTPTRSYFLAFLIYLDRDAANTLISFKANDQRSTKIFWQTGKQRPPITLTVDLNQKCEAVDDRILNKRLLLYLKS
ncbi:hypothetical protein P7K49_031830 [Saguinus oedipus]|uniref:Cystatin LXN-type domain-containing protein n=1 Tax=Saguinus oedipus TaxID=9490 RepID=A0ABQ9U0I7_SAGOE|nr:hypothetical protein P7K49_031830 [Saguinus oedipus]